MPERDPYEVIIGLEVHAQLLTKTKLFCSDTTIFGAQPNTQISAVSLGYPGTLPRMNRKVIPLALRLGLATNCEIVRVNYFARKNYFYPDLPKGYQISQHTTPVCRNGFLELNLGGNKKKIRLNRIHMEEDAGKSIHDAHSDNTCIDYNRAGMPLLEIVTEPDIRTAEEAAAYVTALRKLVRHLGVCDGNMQEGSLRCDVNISIRLKGDEKLGTRVEIKNLNSIRFIRKAIEHETERLIELHRNNKPIVQQTRGFDETDGTTYAIRTKEDEDDYRYFPEPDLPPFIISEEMIEAVRKQMPELPESLQQRFQVEFGLTEYDARLMADDPELSGLFLQLAKETGNYKAAANWIIGPVKNHLALQDISLEETGITASSLALLIRFIGEGKISYGIASQKVFPELAAHKHLDVMAFISEHQLFVQNADDEIEQMIIAALQKHAQKINEYKKGKKGLLSLFVGEVMKLSKGRADAQLVTQKILEKLNN